MANEMLTGMLSQPKGPSAPRPQQPGLQNQTNNAQWWKGSTGAPAPMGATSGYGSSTPTPPPAGTPPAGTPPAGGGTGGWTGGTPAPAKMSGSSIWNTANHYQSLMDKIARMDARRGQSGRFSGSPQDIARMNQDYQRAQESAEVWKASLEKSMADYKGFGWAGGDDPRAMLMEFSSGQGRDNITALIDSMYGPSAPRMTPPGYVDPAGFGASFGGPTFGGGPPKPPKGGGWR